jgi:hypothetical protein
MQISIPVTITVPGYTIHNAIFNTDIPVPPTTSACVALITLDATATTELQSLFTPSNGTPTLTPAQLGTQYPSSVLEAALVIALQAGR